MIYRKILNFLHFLHYFYEVITIFLGLAAMEVDLAVIILYLVLIIVIFVGHEAFNFYQSRTGKSTLKAIV